MNAESKIYVAGHTGLVGSALVRRLEAGGFHGLLCRTHAELDLTDQRATAGFFDREKPEYVFLAAAKVGGIMANARAPADFIITNLQIQTNVIDACRRQGVKKLLFLGSSCVYPKHAPQPLREEYLLSGALEPTNEAYAAAKIAGIIACRSCNQQCGTNFIAAMPANLYGPHDHFDPDSSHVLPALLRKFHHAALEKAAVVQLWGTGAPRREFLYVDDLAEALVFLMQSHEATPETTMINIGSGEEVTIAELASLIAAVAGYQGRIAWDPSYPDGTPRKLVDARRLAALGWRAKFTLAEGLRLTYQWFLENGA